MLRVPVRDLTRVCVISYFSFWTMMPLAFAQKPKLTTEKVAATPSDPLGRTNPRSAVTGYLEACHEKNYSKAAGYLDLNQIPERERSSEGPKLAKQLEAAFNSDSSFDVMQLNQDPQGNPADDPEPTIEHIANIAQPNGNVSIELQQVSASGGTPLWLFSAATVARIPQLFGLGTNWNGLEGFLPRFLVAIELWDTPIWKWIALLIAAAVVILAFRFALRKAEFLLKAAEQRIRRPGSGAWMRAIVQPLLVLLATMAFRLIEQVIGPSALTRLYIGRALLLAVVWSIAWGAINLIDVFLTQLDTILDPRQRVVSHSLIYLGRRVSKVMVVMFAAIVVLSNWGYDMTTIIAGLGVGGFAIALAAQQTVANVFGGVSVIGDNPVMVGDSGNFGGLSGTVEDIGMRSTRVRTVKRTVVSIPNSSFAGMNLENYSARDKTLFQTTLQIKRTTPKDQLRHCMASIEKTLGCRTGVEVGATPVRVKGFSASAFLLEVMAYVLTKDDDEFHKVETELYFALDDAITGCGVELA